MYVHMFVCIIRSRSCFRSWRLSRGLSGLPSAWG